MIPKGILKDTSFTVQILFFIVLVVVGSMFSSFVAMIFVFAKNGFSVQTSLDLMNNIYSNPDLIRTLQFFQSLGTFFFPAIILAQLYSPDKNEYLQTENHLSPSIIGLSILSLIIAIPFLNMVTYLNQQIQFPEALKGIETFMKEMETRNQGILDAMLYTNDLSTLLMNILVIAVIAGVGEEFLFRGVLQNIFFKLTKNHHIVIWVVAIIFSAIHFQFYGFFTRMLLGAFLGYLLYYSKNIWIPVLIHFTHNFLGVMAYYNSPTSEKLREMDGLGTSDTWWLAVASISLWFLVFSLFIKKCKSEHLSS